MKNINFIPKQLSFAERLAIKKWMIFSASSLGFLVMIIIFIEIPHYKVLTYAQNNLLSVRKKADAFHHISAQFQELKIQEEAHKKKYNTLIKKQQRTNLIHTFFQKLISNTQYPITCTQISIVDTLISFTLTGLTPQVAQFFLTILAECDLIHAISLNSIHSDHTHVSASFTAQFI